MTVAQESYHTGRKFLLNLWSSGMFFKKKVNWFTVLSRLCFFNTIVLILTVLLLTTWTSSRAVFLSDPHESAMKAFQKVNCLSQEQFDYYKDIVLTLGYTNLDIFSQFCKLPNSGPEEAIDVLKRLARVRIKFDHAVIFKHFLLQDDISMEEGWQLLSRLGNLGYSPTRALMGLTRTPPLPLADMEKIITQVESKDEAGYWAIKSFLLLPGQSATTIHKGLAELNAMDEDQRWAVDSLCKVKGADLSSAFEAMEIIGSLSDNDARNLKQLLELSCMTPEAALSWTRNYFTLGLQGEEGYYFSLDSENKSILLEAFNDGVDYFVWKINNLHDVTDRSGREIGSRRLTTSSVEQLAQLFYRLDESVRQRFRENWRSAVKTADKTALIRTLRQATSVARSQAARDLTSANSYILLSRGAELYDSSFRDILVPVLKKRIADTFNDNLLQFLLAVDPDNIYVSDFIVSLAQKGRLMNFFPEKAAEQEQVLDLVAESAFRDENSLVNFSATFMKILKIIKPMVRSYLIDKMLSCIEDERTVFTTQLRVILQYYLTEYPDLLGYHEKEAITRMITKHGSIDLNVFTETAFVEWKKDGKLQSLSIFQTDDDGRKSFFSNCRTLLGNGYKPRLSVSYQLLSNSSEIIGSAYEVIKSVPAHPTNGLVKLYKLMSTHPVIVDWTKHVNGIAISHSVFVYQGEVIQQRLLEQFIKKGHEMFAQRGHSYWRREQLFDPIAKLMESGVIDNQDLQAKQRFMSIGSCGGIRAYSELNNIFDNNVDILATVGTGKSVVNDPYNQKFFEIIARSADSISWKEVAEKTFYIFEQGLGEEYLQPGGLPAILHKIMDLKQGKSKS